MSLDDITLAVDYFDLKKIAESGQCFRWKELGPGKYLIPSGQTCAIMEQKEPDDDLHLLIEEGTLPLWQDYLNYGERYGSIIREAREATLADGSPDLFLREAVLEAAGVQILTQDLWETLVSFVISQNNNIPRIKKLVAALCKQFGERRQLAGHEFYTFPTWERLAGQDLSSIGLGYRDKYVEQLAQNVTDGRIDLHELTGMETEQARTYLKSIHGVGNKVADCVLLFGLHRVEAFPVDTWIRQVIDEHYDAKIPDESVEVTVTPHKVGDGGILAMPLKANIPDPQRDDWKLVTCPICGAECWENDIARQAMAAEPELHAACTACALKAGFAAGGKH